MIPFLEYLAAMSVDDVRHTLKSYEGKDIPVEFHQRESRARDALQKNLEKEKKKVRRSGTASSLGSMLGFKSPEPQIPGEQSPSEAFAQGKTISDQIRERGQKGYEQLDKEIREHGEKILEDMANDEKKAIEDAMKSWQGSMTGWVWGFFGSSSSGDRSDQQENEKK